MAEVMGLSLIHEVETSGDGAVDIIAVHGLGGHSSTTWTSQESGNLWLRDLLPESIPEARILTYGYSSCVTNAVPNIISSTAQSLLEALTEKRGQDQEDSNRRLIFIGHSLGGLVIKQALLLASDSLHDSHRSILRSTSGIVFLGTPHRDSASGIARVLQYITSVGIGKGELNARALPPELASQLGHIQEAFQEFHTRKLSKFQIISFFEELPIPGFGLVVDEHSATDTPSSFTFLPIYANHETICKFASPSGSDYQRVLAELKKLTHTEVKKQNKRNSKQLSQGIKEIVNSTNLTTFEWAFKHSNVDNGSGCVNPAHPNTCEWVWNHNDFNLWLRGSDSSIFWITGKPGSGKSTLMKYITQNLEDRTVGIPRLMLAHFVFKQPHDTTYRGAFLQSLVFQVLSQTSHPMSDFIPLLSQLRDFCTKLDESSNKWRPSIPKNLDDLFRDLLRKVSETRRIYFFVDAFDECSEEDTSGILSLISSMDLSLLKNPIKLCMTSRLNPYLETSYQGHRKIVLENENAADIQRYVHSTVAIERLAQFPEGERGETIVNLIAETSGGVFLWAKLVTNNILQHIKDRAEKLDSLLLDLPSDLEGLYRLYLGQIVHKEDKLANLAEKLLKWVCYARRPLSVGELTGALALDATLQGIRADSSKATAQSESELFTAVRYQLLTRCEGLLEIREPGSKIHLVHHSAKEFLLNTTLSKTGCKEDLKLHSFQNAHIDLAETCLLYLSIDMHTGREGHKAVDGFLDYASDYWHEHTKLADYPGISHTPLLKLLGWPSTKILGHLAHLHQKKVGNSKPSNYLGWTALHASAAFGLYNLGLAIRDMEHSNLTQWDIRDASGRTPLSIAVNEGHISIVKLLLNTGASIATRDTRYGFSPLMWAALQGYREALELLLQKGADVNDSASGCTPIWLAAARGHKAVLELLLARGANPNLADKHYGWTPLHLTAGYGNEAAVLLLLAHGANPNIVNPFTNQTPLYYATAGGHLSCVRTLLDHGSRMQQSALEPASNIPISWVDRVAYSFLRPLRNDRFSNPISCAPRKTNAPSSSSCQANLGQTSDNSKKTSNKRPLEISESGLGDGVGGSGNDPNKKPTLDPTPSSSLGGPSLKLACPYYKYDPERYISEKICCGPVGWPTVSRLKEHLHKRHFVQVCQRCCNAFKSLEDLEIHSKAVMPCSAKLERDYGDGFDHNQQRLLHCRTDKKKAQNNELEYWKILYRILFPRVPISSIPSPCYDEEQTVTKRAYDKACALARNQDASLRSAILQLVHDPTLVESLINLVNRHQEVSVGPVPITRDATPLVTSNMSQLTNSGELPMYQPPPLGDATFTFCQPSFFQMPTPLFAQPSTSQADSGFYPGLYTGSSAMAEGDDMSLQLQPDEFSYGSRGFFNIQGSAADQGIRDSTLGQGTIEANILEHIDDLDNQVTLGAEDAYVSDISQK